MIEAEKEKQHQDRVAKGLEEPDKVDNLAPGLASKLRAQGWLRDHPPGTDEKLFELLDV